MMISNTQAVQPVQQTLQAKETNVEDLVNTQEQEYPKPSIPVENDPTAPVKLTTPESLTDGQTLAVKASSTQDKIDAYKAGMEESDENFDIKATQNKVQDLKELQDIQNKKNGMDTYNSLIGT